ncbi:MAG: DUF695 domain-containing protein [Christensenellaceae bacterium]|nr:DUF695 domain-containing protein [Christensenellaceae bacterium]
MAKKNTILKYDWRLGSADAEFCVDERLYPNAPMENLPLLASMQCSNAKEKEFTNLDLRHMNEFASKCERKLGFFFAGYIHTAVMRRYFIYLPDEEAGSHFTQLAEKQRNLDVRVEIKSDPSWSVYFKLLYPDTAKMQTVRNGEIIKMHYDNGDSTAARRLNLHMYFKSEPIRMQFEEAARLEGFAIGNTEERYPDGDQHDEDHKAEFNASQTPKADASHGEHLRAEFNASQTPKADASYGEHQLIYGVVLHRICAMKKREVDAVTVHAIRIAERFGGALAYWDCPIVPRAGK